MRNQKRNADYQKKFRASEKKKKEALSKVSEAASVLKCRESSGRPSLEEYQPGLLKAIVDIDTFGGATYDRKRTEEIRACVI